MNCAANSLDKAVFMRIVYNGGATLNLYHDNYFKEIYHG